MSYRKPLIPGHRTLTFWPSSLTYDDSPVFREMLSLPTKGGPIGLPETAVQIRMVLDKMTDNPEERAVDVADTIAALELARRFQFTSMAQLFRQKLLDSGSNRDAPAILAHACHSRPIDRLLAKSALSLFQDLMPITSNVFRGSVSHRKGDCASPALDNLKRSFLESLGVIGAVAYALTLDDCKSTSLYHWKAWDWTVVPRRFLEHVVDMEK